MFLPQEWPFVDARVFISPHYQRTNSAILPKTLISREKLHYSPAWRLGICKLFSPQVDQESSGVRLEPPLKCILVKPWRGQGRKWSLEKGNELLRVTWANVDAIRRQPGFSGTSPVPSVHPPTPHLQRPPHGKVCGVFCWLSQWLSHDNDGRPRDWAHPWSWERECLFLNSWPSWRRAILPFEACLWLHDLQCEEIRRTVCPKVTLLLWTDTAAEESGESSPPFFL